MAAPTERSGPTAQQLADAAHLRAWGHDWESIGAVLRCEWLSLRRAAEVDSGFAAALEREGEAATREGEAKALRRLRALTDSDDPKIALRASEVLVRCARERHHEACGVPAPSRTVTDAKPADRSAEKGSVRVPQKLIAPPRTPAAFRAVPLTAVGGADRPLSAPRGSLQGK